MDAKKFIYEYINKLIQIQEPLLNFLENDDIQNFETKYLDDLKIKENKHKMRILLYLISKISQNHHRNPNFIDKVEKILLTYKKEIKIFFSNLEIFLIFKKNKRILYFLYKEQIIIPNKTILTNTKNSYSFYAYFYPEFKKFYNEKSKQQIASEYSEIFNLKEFEEKRMIGENDHYVCELIRNDSIDDFISFVNRTNLSLSSNVEPSVYETNSLLIKKETSLIEYSAFYGSIQIFRFLLLNNVKIKTDTWLFAIHGKNPEIIHILEENQIKPPSNNNYVRCYIESNKCYHNDIMKYFQLQYIEVSDNYNFYLSIKDDICFRTFNFYDFFDNDYKTNESTAFYFACKYDHFLIVDYFLNNARIEFNSTTIFKNEFL